MSGINRILYLALIAVVLVGCTVTIDLEPPWRRNTFHLHPPHNREEPVMVTPAPTSSVVTITNTIVPTPSVQTPIHILDIRPLTLTGAFSLTTLVDANSMYFASACTVNDALGEAPPKLNDGVVVAAVTYISGTVPVDSGTDARAAFDPTLGRTVYWSGDSGSSTPNCPASGSWLWQEVVLMPDSSAEGFSPALLSLPAQSACEFGSGFTPAVFGEMVAKKGEWPQLLYITQDEEKPALLLLQQGHCGSDAGCASVRAACQSLFADDAWQEWCASLCS